MSSNSNNKGIILEFTIGRFFQASVSFLTFIQFGFYVLQYRRKRCFGETLYLSFVQFLAYLLRASVPENSPGPYAVLDGQPNTYWVRYAAWLLTCPTLITMMSNAAGDNSFSPRKLLLLLKVDQAMLVFGITATFANAPLKWVLFACGSVAGVVLYLMLYFIYQYTKETLPPRAQPYVNTIFRLTFIFWLGYPILFVVGPSGLDKVDNDVLGVLHSILDIFAKNVFSITGWYLRWCVLRRYSDSEPRIIYSDEEFYNNDGKNNDSKPVVGAGNIFNDDESSRSTTEPTDDYNTNPNCNAGIDDRISMRTDSVGTRANSGDLMEIVDPYRSKHLLTKNSYPSMRSESRNNVENVDGGYMEPDEVRISLKNGHQRPLKLLAPLYGDPRLLVISDPITKAPGTASSVLDCIIQIASSAGWLVKIDYSSNDAMADIFDVAPERRPHAVLFNTMVVPGQASIAAKEILQISEGIMPAPAHARALSLEILQNGVGVYSQDGGNSASLSEYLTECGIKTLIPIDVAPRTNGGSSPGVGKEGELKLTEWMRNLKGSPTARLDSTGQRGDRWNGYGYRDRMSVDNLRTPSGSWRYSHRSQADVEFPVEGSDFRSMSRMSSVRSVSNTPTPQARGQRNSAPTHEIRRSASAASNTSRSSSQRPGGPPRTLRRRSSLDKLKSAISFFDGTGRSKSQEELKT